MFDFGQEKLRHLPIVPVSSSSLPDQISNPTSNRTSYHTSRHTGRRLYQNDLAEHLAAVSLDTWSKCLLCPIKNRARVEKIALVKIDGRHLHEAPHCAYIAAGRAKRSNSITGIGITGEAYHDLCERTYLSSGPAPQHVQSVSTVWTPWPYHYEAWSQ